MKLVEERQLQGADLFKGIQVFVGRKRSYSRRVGHGHCWFGRGNGSQSRWGEAGMVFSLKNKRGVNQHKFIFLDRRNRHDRRKTGSGEGVRRHAHRQSENHRFGWQKVAGERFLSLEMIFLEYTRRNIKSVIFRQRCIHEQIFEKPDIKRYS